MTFCDTHTHIYLPEYSDDRAEVVDRAVEAGIRYMFIPHIDSGSTADMQKLCDAFPAHCFPMMGLHPTSVKGNFRDELAWVEECLESRKYYGIGEAGIDLYWDTSFRKQQEKVLEREIELAIRYDLPLIIHTRNSIEIAIEIVKEFSSEKLKGIFHCFPGNIEQAEEVAGLGFMIGIGGVVTYKNSLIAKVAGAIPLEFIVLETDAPFLSPVPHRGKRNEPAYIRNIADSVASIKKVTKSEVARQTTENSLKIFKLNNKV